MKYVVKVKKERCKSCKLCIEVCPSGIFRLSDKFNKMGYHYIEVDKENNCIGCKRCVIICPDVAIEIYRDEEINKNK